MMSGCFNYFAYFHQYPVIFFGQPKFDDDKLKRLDDAVEFVESYLEHGYIAGSTLSIADIAVVVTLSTMEAFGHNLEKFPKVHCEQNNSEILQYYSWL